MSEAVPTQEGKVRWLKVAQQWRELAEAADQRGRAECEQLSELATDPSTKAIYLRMADCYRRMADNHQFVDETDGFLDKSA